MVFLLRQGPRDFQVYFPHMSRSYDEVFTYQSVLGINHTEGNDKWHLSVLHNDMNFHSFR